MDDTTRRVLPMLPVLAAFAETGQVTAAADLLRMPQPTVSRTLARLGRELGVPVVARHGRTVRLTPAGETLAAHAAAVLAAATVGVEAVRAREAGTRGSVGLAFQNTLGERVVPALVRSFRQEHPGAHVELLQASRARCLDALVDGDADFAFVSPVEHRPGLTTLRLYTEPLVLVVPHGHPLATRPRITLDAVASETFVCMKPGFGMRTIVENIAAAAGFVPTVGFEGDDLATLRGLVSAGLGVGVAPRDPHGAPGCVEVPIDDPNAVRHIGVCWREDAPSGPAAAFRALLRHRGRRLTEIGLRPYAGR